MNPPVFSDSAIIFSELPLGAKVTSEGVGYRVWAPKGTAVTVEVFSFENNSARSVRLQKLDGGFYAGIDAAGQPGDRYRFRVEGHGTFPDPVSRVQEKDVHGLSVVIDSTSFSWSDAEFRAPDFRNLVIYEIHIGTFTSEGTFRAAIERLDYLRDLGVTAIEIMPIADFPGARNWGYDGVTLFAPARCYGSPDDLRALVDAAHSRGLAVILDVVYNHFGPDGNYLSRYSDTYFSKKHHTPWGAALNFDGEGSAPVREFFIGNPLYWMEEFHIDGFRFDAAHEIKVDSNPHILAEMTAAVRARGGFCIAEDERNEFRVISPVADGGLGFDGVWADDFHHSARVGLTGEQAAYFANFAGTPGEIAQTLRQGWLYTGQIQKAPPTPRGTPTDHLPPERFIHCISNHDQVGNRALGERLHQLTSPAAYRALSAFLCLSPYTPLLFMGQEWGASTPFLFFTDHDGELGRKITEGRRKEFASFGEFDQPEEQAKIPDPQSPETFQRSKLKWDELDREPHAHLVALHRACLRLRFDHAALRPDSRDTWTVEETLWGAVAIRYMESSLRIIVDLAGGNHGEIDPPPDGQKWRVLLSTEEVGIGGNGKTILEGTAVSFEEPGLLLLGV